MKLTLLASLVAIAPQAYAVVYAPVPVQEQGNPVTVSLRSELGYDSNVLGTDGETFEEKESAYWQFVPRIELNRPLTDQTFVEAYYQADVRIYDDRDLKPIGPGAEIENEEDIVNHFVGGSVSHSFSERFELKVSDDYQMIDDPKTTVRGLGIDQSYDRNDFQARAMTDLSDLHGLVFKYRNLDYAYDQQVFADRLDRNTDILGAQYLFRWKPNLSLVGEYRYQDTQYDGATGSFNDSDSNFFLVGADWAPSSQLSTSLRVGSESREFDNAGLTSSSSAYREDNDSLYLQALASYTYAEQSFISGAVTFDQQETTSFGYGSEDVLAFVVNVQHMVAPAWYVSGSFAYENYDLQSTNQIPGLSDIQDDVIRLGTTVTWRPDERWSVYASYDLDSVDSDDSGRDEERHRVAIGMRYTFGLF